MSQVIIFIIQVIILGLFFYSGFYQAKKRVQYKNDERWQAISNRANQIGLKYYQILVVLIAIITTILLYKPEWNVQLSLSRVLMFGFFLICLEQFVETLGIKYYDKHM